MKYSSLFFLLFALSLQLLQSQEVKYEREYRIRKSQFPEKARALMEPYTESARRIRYYREIDSNRSSYEMKFKLARLHYSVEFNPEGQLEDVEIRIKPVDLPNSSWQAIMTDLRTRFKKFKVRKIQQQYPREAFPDDATTLRNAFQNLILPQIRYELVVGARESTGYLDYELLYDAEGSFLKLRKSLPPNYDHVLY